MSSTAKIIMTIVSAIIFIFILYAKRGYDEKHSHLVDRDSRVGETGFDISFWSIICDEDGNFKPLGKIIIFGFFVVMNAMMWIRM